MIIRATDGTPALRDPFAFSDAPKADAFKAKLDQHATATSAQQKQAAANKEEHKADCGKGGLLTRSLGALQAAAGIVEVVSGVAGGVLTSETGVGLVAGGVIALHGVDDIQAGLRTAFSGQSTDTFTQSATANTAKALGASPEVAMGLGIGVDLVAGGVAAGEKTAIKGAEALEDAAKAAGKSGDAVRLGTEARFGLATSTDYKATFFQAHPELEGSVVVHHAVEQQVLTRYPGLVSEGQMHSLENLRGIPTELNSDLHLSQIRREWNQFYRSHPNPTQQDFLNKATEIDTKFGSQFRPPVR